MASIDHSQEKQSLRIRDLGALQEAYERGVGRLSEWDLIKCRDILPLSSLVRWEV